MTAVGLDPNTLLAPRKAQSASSDGPRNAAMSGRSASATRDRFRLDDASKKPSDATLRAGNTLDAGRRSPATSTSGRDRTSASETARTEAAPVATKPEAKPTSKRDVAGNGKTSTDRGAKAKSSASKPDETDNRTDDADAATGDRDRTPSVSAADLPSGAEDDSTESTPTAFDTAVVPPIPVQPQAVQPTPVATPSGPEKPTAAATATQASGEAVAVADAQGGKIAVPTEGTASDALNAGPAFASILETAADTASTAGPGPAVTTQATQSPEVRSTLPAMPSQQVSSPPIPLGAVPMTIGLKSLQGSSRFEIRLDPVDLGRIDVKLDIDKDGGAVSASLVVDRPATLALLQRDAGALQQALTQAGFDASSGINLSLRDGNASGGQNQGGGTPRGPAGLLSQTHQQNVPDANDFQPARLLRLSGIDISI